ncbi:MAG: hypothetical protein HYZ26_09000 [Chloroflexi bacterium]|nr:hypothetical protein [Chloroflexota bacterium]
MAAARKVGKKHTILFYKHSMDRVWRSMLVLSLLLVPVWFFAPGLLGIPKGSLADNALMGAMIVALIGALFTFFVRNMAYVQVKTDHVLIATPFLKLKISFRRMRSIRSMELSQMYDYRRLSWADRRFLRPYFGKTILTIVVKNYPLSMGTMKLFLPKFMFNPMDKGFVLLVKDWMTLSTEFDTLIGSFRESLRDNPRRQESMRGLYG